MDFWMDVFNGFSMEFDRHSCLVLFEGILMDFGGATTSEVFFRFFFPECVHLEKLFWESIGQPHGLTILKMVDDHMPVQSVIWGYTGIHGLPVYFWTTPNHICCTYSY